MFKLGKQALKTYQRYKQRARAKIKRLESKGIDVSEYINIPNKDEFNTRKEYNQWKKQVDRFTDRNNSDFKAKKSKEGFYYLGIERKQLINKTKESISRAKQRQNELNELPIYDENGNVVSTVKRQQSHYKDEETGFVKVPTLLDVDDLPSRNALLKRISKMKERSTEEYFNKRDEQMRENWIDLMYISFGDEADELVSKVKSMNVLDFVEMYWMFRDFKFNYYDSKKGYLGDNPNAQLEELNKSVDMYIKGEVDKDFKNFR